MFKHIFFNSNLIWNKASLRQSLGCGSNQKKCPAVGAKATQPDTVLVYLKDLCLFSPYQ